MSYKNFIEAAEDKGEHRFGVSVEQIHRTTLSFMVYYPHYPQIYLDDEDIEYLYNKYRSRAEVEIKEEKERRKKQKQDELHRKIGELNRLKEEIENE